MLNLVNSLPTLEVRVNRWLTPVIVTWGYFMRVLLQSRY